MDLEHVEPFNEFPNPKYANTGNLNFDGVFLGKTCSSSHFLKHILDFGVVFHLAVRHFVNNDKVN